MGRKSVRRELREQSRASEALPKSPSTSIPPSPRPQIPLHPQKPMSITPIPASGATNLPRLLLICSIGNPAPYINTFHSAGHCVLSALRTHLSYPPFHSSRDHGKGQISRGQDALLWQSPTSMNVSGPAVASAWRTFVKESDNTRAPRLVILHDELELDLGKIKMRKPGAGLRGHNGLRSIAGVGDSVGGDEGWWRIGIGIGRPASRESGIVGDYVLRKMTGGEMEKIKGAVGQVVEELLKLRDE